MASGAMGEERDYEGAAGQSPENCDAGFHFLMAGPASRPGDDPKVHLRATRPKLNLMTCDDLRLLIDYHYWARDRVLDAVSAITLEQFTRPMGNSFSSVRDTVAHICAAERIWITRLKGEKPQGLQKPDRLADVDAARKEWSELEGEMRERLARLGPEAVNRTVEYQDLRGNDQSDVLWQMLQHVVNHGTYHRGQITTMLRQLDAAPPKSMDLIAFYRERKQNA